MAVKDATQNEVEQRLAEIEEELANLREEQRRIQAKWQAEKEVITRIRELKEQIEQAKIQAEEYERQGDFGKVAEIRYGTIVTLQKQLNEAKQKNGRDAKKWCHDKRRNWC